MSNMSKSRPRTNVATNVKRALWAESMGYCMRPKCDTRLLDEGTNVAEQAHIVPHADGGADSAENLILLCRSCHKKIDDNRDAFTVPKLKRWKKCQNEFIRRKMTQGYSSYGDLVEVVVPLLEANARFFGTYGPDSNMDIASASATYSLWRKHEPEILANNERLSLILETNRNHFHSENWETVERFIIHAREFALTRDGRPPRKALFPTELLAMFGITTNPGHMPQSVSTLQNLIRQLQEDGSFVRLDLMPNPKVYYMKDNVCRSFDLNNRALMQQIYWNRWCYHPITTELRLNNLLFLLGWLQRNGISYDLSDPSDLTSLTVAENYRVNLFYEYVLTLENLYDVVNDTDSIVLNLYDWNGGRATQEALQYAEEIGITVLMKQEFFRFAHRKLK